MVQVHIFLKELVAAVWTLERNMSNNTEFIIGIDNSAAAHAIENLYSSNTTANCFLKRLAHLLRKNHSHVIVAQIRSKQNAADNPSRGKPVDTSLMSSCLAILMRKREGYNERYDWRMTATGSIISSARHVRLRHR